MSTDKWAARRRWISRDAGHFQTLLHGLLQALLGPGCTHCHSMATARLRSTILLPFSARRRYHTMLFMYGVNQFNRDAMLVRSGHKDYLCDNCSPTPPKCSSRNAHAAAAAHAALRAMLGTACCSCGATTDLTIDQVEPPAYRTWPADREQTRSRPRQGGPRRFLYYAALARGGRARVLCRSCNGHEPIEHPNWRAQLVARATRH